MKILVTADIHHSKLILKQNQECINFFNNTIINEKPDMFVIAGDLNDSQNLKSGSDEMRELVKFIKSVVKTANENNCRLIVLRGTKGHDGDVIKTIHASISEKEYSFEYIETPEIIFHSNYSFLFLPEMYLPSLKDFEDLLDKKTRYEKVDCIFFHGMMDFAIPQLKQVDSTYGLSRSIVIDSNKLRQRFNLCAVGGHVHAKIKERNIIYTNSPINSIGDVNMDLGIGKLELFSKSYYEYSTIINPHNIAHKVVYLDFTSKLLSEIDNEVNKLVENYNIEYIIFNAIVDASPSTLQNYTTFIRKYNPKYIKKKIKDTSKVNKVSTSDLKYKATLSSEDIVSMIIKIAKEKYDKKIEQTKVKEYLNIE